MKDKEVNLEEVEMILEEGFDGVYAVSLVDKPATQSNFIYLSAEKVLLKVIDEEKRIVTGALLIPEQRVKRKDDESGEAYNIFFTADTISALSEKFMRDHNNSNITMEHSSVVQDIDIVESWIKTDDKADKSVALGIDVPVGSWLVTAKINNDEVWNNQVKTGRISGFSIEAQMQRKNNINLKSDLTMSEKTLLEKISALVKGVTQPVVETEVVEQAETDVDPIPEVTEEVPAEEDEEPTYVSVEEFKALEDKFKEQQLVLEAIVDFLGADFKPAEGEATEVVEETVEASVETENLVKDEEKIEASEVTVEEVVVEEKVAFVALPNKKANAPIKLQKFDNSLTVAERIALNFKNY